jgi:PIN domain nuclease of toxin-antitoxin system
MADEGLDDQQKELVNAAAMGALVELLTGHPEVAKLPVGVITTVFLAGVGAGVDALDHVLKARLVEL